MVPVISNRIFIYTTWTLWPLAVLQTNLIGASIVEMENPGSTSFPIRRSWSRSYCVDPAGRPANNHDLYRFRWDIDRSALSGRNF